MFKEKKKWTMGFFHILLWIPIVVLLMHSIQYQRIGPTIQSVAHLDQVQLKIGDENIKEVQLPIELDIPKSTPITLWATIQPQPDDQLFVHIDHSPAKVYVNDRLLFEFGNMKNYPPYMKDPVNELKIIPLQATNEKMQLRIEYMSSSLQHTTSIQAPMVGTSIELIMERSRLYGMPLIFSLLEIFAGLALIFISFFLFPVDKKEQIFFWLGMASFMIGCWEFGQNPFASVIFKQNSFLYMLSYIGLFTFVIPMIHFARQMVNFINDRPFWCLELFFSIGACLALVLQWSGIYMLHQSYQLFHHIIPLTLLFMMGYLIREFRYYSNPMAKRLAIPLGILTVTTVLQYFNIQPPFPFLFSSFSQMGMIIFLLCIGILSGLYMKDSIDLQHRQKQLEFEKNLLNFQMEEQKSKSMMLAKNEQILRQQRHDLRHQLIIIQELSQKDPEQLQMYLNSLMEQIPKSMTNYCIHPIVNAVISHFANVCQQQNIVFSCMLDVPIIDQATTDTMLVAIFSNLLENAVEACMYVDASERFITLKSKMQYDMLSITMDNSFDGTFQIRDGKYISKKRNDFGVGISSIEMMSKKLNGECHFTTNGNIFLSNVFVKL